jgi:hypothetical protein
LMLAYRSAKHDSLGTSPCSMLFGREMNLPIDLVLGRHGCNEYSHELKTVYAAQVITVTSCLPMDLFKVIKRKVILNSLGIVQQLIISI